MNQYCCTLFTIEQETVVDVVVVVRLFLHYKQTIFALLTGWRSHAGQWMVECQLEEQGWFTCLEYFVKFELKSNSDISN